MMNPTVPASVAARKTVRSFFGRRFPFKSRYDFSDPEVLAKLQGYKFWKGLTRILTFICLLGLPLLYAFLLHRIYVGVYRALLPEQMIFFPITWLSFLLTGLPLMLMTLGWPISLVQRIGLRSRYDLFADRFNDEAGYDNIVASRWLRKLMIAPLVLALIANAFAHLYLDERGVAYRAFFYLTEHRYNYREVSAIQYIGFFENREGKLAVARAYQVLFADGSKLTQGTYFNNAEEMNAFIVPLQRRTGLAIDSIPILPYD